MLSLNYRDSRPIYEQVRDGLRRLIITGAIPPGDKLPSVRSMAGQLAINPNTIQRAYESLEQEGYAYSVPGKGSFAALPQDVTDKRREELLAKLDAIVQELVYLGMTPAEIGERCAAFEEARSRCEQRGWTGAGASDGPQGGPETSPSRKEAACREQAQRDKGKEETQ